MTVARPERANDDRLVIHILGSLEGGGAESFLRDLAPRLQRRGIPTEIVCAYNPRLSSERLAELGVPVHSRAKRPGFDPAHFAWLVRLLRERKPAIVHTHQWAGKYLGRTAAIAARVPAVVHTEHSPHPLGRVESLMAELLWRKTDCVIAFTPMIAELVRSREPVRDFAVIRTGIDIPPAPTDDDRTRARSLLGVTPGTVVFASVGSLYERKNHQLALEAFSIVSRESGPPMRLDIFGEGPLREMLSERSRQLNVDCATVFHGFTSNVCELLPGVDVFVTLATLEMAPISILEAMARELPVIGAPHPGTLEMVEPEVTGTIVQWDVQSVATAMRRARADAAWRRKAGTNGRARVIRDYDVESMAQRYAELYSRLGPGQAPRKRKRVASPR